MSGTTEMRVREIQVGDDPDIAGVIRTVMTECGASGDGFSIHDVEVDRMSEAYAGPDAAYFVIVSGDTVLGGSGIAPLEGGPDQVCELKKMYLLPEIRGRGLGHDLLKRCLDAARDRGFTLCYLESLEGMTEARRLYERAGFCRVASPMGRTGHFSCDAWYVLEI